MCYGISIDWLSLLCDAADGSFVPKATSSYTSGRVRDWHYEKMAYGTRQFAELWKVSINKEEICEVQTKPYSSILKPYQVIVKFSNRLLYCSSLWWEVESFCEEHRLEIMQISRIDICADFHAFYKYECIPFITDFLAGKIRHKGRGKGAAYFFHKSENIMGYSRSRVNYTGLSFGSNESDVRAYLYNKTFELQTVKDKPYIRDFWRSIGLGAKDVWRLEVSIKSGGRKFKDKTTQDEHEIVPADLKERSELVGLFHTFERKYFAFIVNRAGITNISREPLIKLFDGQPLYNHCVIRNVSAGNRTERILIKQLWQMSDTYRGEGEHSDEGITKLLATSLANATDLRDWLSKKKTTWHKPLTKK